MNNYISIYLPGHHLANQKGFVYQHQIVAEIILKRELLPNEVVHHIDKNKSNNDPNNIMVFATKGDHTSFHRKGCDESYLQKLDNGSFITTQRAMVCPICGNKKDSHAKYCIQCYLKDPSRYKSVNGKPDINLLQQQLIINNGNFTKIAKEYGVTDNAVRKWCKSYNLPFHSRDYKKNNCEFKSHLGHHLQKEDYQ